MNNTSNKTHQSKRYKHHLLNRRDIELDCLKDDFDEALAWLLLKMYALENRHVVEIIPSYMSFS